jgi:hypothetical protein
MRKPTLEKARHKTITSLHQQSQYLTQIVWPRSHAHSCIGYGNTDARLEAKQAVQSQVTRSKNIKAFKKKQKHKTK